MCRSRTIPLGIVMDGQWIMTVCRHDHDLLREMAAGKMRGLSTAKRNRFILQVLLAAASKYLLHLREINRTVEGLEDQLQMSMQNRELLALLQYQKSLVYFTTALKANELMMERLHRSGFFRTYPDDEDLLEDVITENQQAIEMTNIASQHSQLDDGRVRVDHLQQRERGDEVPGRRHHRDRAADAGSPACIGMNVRLPFQDHALAFVFVVAVAIGDCAVAAVVATRIWF